MRALPFASYLGAAFVAAFLVAWLPIHFGGVHDYLRYALPLALAWLAWLALGIFLYGRRGLWLLLAAPPAAFWLYLGAAAFICAQGCG